MDQQNENESIHVYRMEKAIAQLPMPPIPSQPLQSIQTNGVSASGPSSPIDQLSSMTKTAFPRHMRRSLIGSPTLNSPGNRGSFHQSSIMTNPNASNTAVYRISTVIGSQSSQPQSADTFTQLEQQWNDIIARVGSTSSSAFVENQSSTIDARKAFDHEPGTLTPPEKTSPSNPTNPPPNSLESQQHRLLPRRKRSFLELPISPKSPGFFQSSDSRPSAEQARFSIDSHRNAIEELRPNSIDALNEPPSTSTATTLFETFTRRRGNSDASPPTMSTSSTDRSRQSSSTRSHSKSLSEKRPLKALFSSFADRKAKSGNASQTSSNTLAESSRYLHTQSIEEEEELAVIEGRDQYDDDIVITKSTNSSASMLFPYRRTRRSSDDDSSTIASLLKQNITGAFFQRNGGDDDGSSSRFRFRGFSHSRNNSIPDEGSLFSGTETIVSRDASEYYDLEGHLGVIAAGSLSRRSSVSLAEGLLKGLRGSPFISPLGVEPQPDIPFFRINIPSETTSTLPGNNIATTLPCLTPPSLRDSSLPMRWSKTSPLSSVHPPPVRSHTMNLVGKLLYVFGGCDDKVCRNDVWTFDMTTWLWTRLNVKGVLPAPRRAHSTAVYQHFLIVFGGGDGPRYFNDVAVLDTRNCTWVENLVIQGQKPSRRRAHSSWTHDTHFYVYAGGDGTQALTDLWQLSGLDTLETDQCVLRWTPVQTKGDVPLARGYHSSILCGDRVLLFGGSDARECFDDLHYLDLNTWSWRKVVVSANNKYVTDSNEGTPSGKTMARLSHATVMVGPYMIVLGGHDGVRYSRSIRILDVRTMRWVPETSVHRQWMYYASRSSNKTLPSTPGTTSRAATVQSTPLKEDKENRHPGREAGSPLPSSEVLPSLRVKDGAQSPALASRGNPTSSVDPLIPIPTQPRRRSHSSPLTPSSGPDALSNVTFMGTPLVPNPTTPSQPLPPLRSVKTQGSTSHSVVDPSTSSRQGHHHSHRQMPSGRGYHTCVVADHRIFFFGGYDGVRVYDDMWTLDLGFRSFLLNVEDNAFCIGQNL